MTAFIKALLDWYKQYRLDIIKAQSDADNAQFILMKEMVVAQTGIIQNWLDGFKVTEIPSSTIMRDEDEYIEEQNRLHPSIKESIENGIKAGAFPELRDILR
jgi:hypothetical protein